MKKVLVTAVLALSTAAWAQTGAPATGTQQPADQAAQGQAQQKTIKDPTEYNAYVAAIQTADPAQKAQQLEAFVQQYPNSIVKEDALEAIMAAYQQQQNFPKMADAAQKLLQVNANHVPATAVLAIHHRTLAQQNQNPQQNLAQAQQYAQRGLQALPNWKKPETVSDGDFQKQKTALTGAFNGIVGLAAFQAKDYATAQRAYGAAVQANANSLEDVYFLALSYLEANPSQDIQGLWYIARATALAAGTPGEAQIGAYGKGKYKRYHGGEDGWAELVAQAKASPTMPAGFTIKPAPTPAEIAGDTLRQYSPKDLNFGDWEFILSSGNQEAANTVWTHMQGLGRMKLTGKVIAATKESVQLAVVPDKQQSNTADVEVTLEEPLAGAAPAVGSTIDVAGEADTFTPDPLMIRLKNGSVLTKAPAAKTPAKKPARRPTTRKR